MKLFNINELKDSRIFFDKKPPMFLTIFIIFLLIMIILSFIFSKFAMKPYIVKAKGIVSSEDNQLVSISINGEVKSISAQEGDKVKKGDVLFTLSTGQEGLQKKALEEQIEPLKEKLEILEKYKKSLDNKKNFLKPSGAEQEFYGRIQYYLMQLKNEEYEKGNIQGQLNDKSRELNKLEDELSSLNEEFNKTKNRLVEENVTQEKAPEKRSIEEKTVEGEDIRDEQSQARKEELMEESTINSNAPNLVDSLGVKENNIEANIESKKTEIKGIKEEIKQMERQVNNPSSTAKETYTQLISEIGSTRFELNTKIAELEGQVLISKGQENGLVIKANNDGVIHYLNPIQKGMAIQANQVVAEISENKPKEFLVEAYIDAKDISKIKLGQDVQVALEGVNTNKYGTVNGKLIKVDSGTITQETPQGNNLYYKCKVSLTSQLLQATDGSDIKLIKSMPVEARIIYEKESYYQWIMEMLNFES